MAGTGPVVVVHGGAGAWASDRLPAGVAGCERAAAAGSERLADGALAAAVAAVKVLEADPNFNAGLGSTLTSAGTVELDAAVMTGDLRFGAVGACPPVASAIELAARLHEAGQYSFLVGDGALEFARKSRIEILGPEDLITPDSRIRSEKAAAESALNAGTVGAVALDAAGRLASATSTGGIANKPRGRVGDTPIVGAGTYADDAAGAASATGVGETIMRALLCRDAVGYLVEGKSLGEAIALAMDRFVRRAGGQGGLILLNKEGEFMTARTTPAMPWAACRPGDRAVSGT